MCTRVAIEWFNWKECPTLDTNVEACVSCLMTDWWSMDVLLHEINFNFMEELKKKIGLDYNRPSGCQLLKKVLVKVF
ncbi:hypothetical protein ACSQ67_001008 [Phaseolus vulgaris]